MRQTLTVYVNEGQTIAKIEDKIQKILDAEIPELNPNVIRGLNKPEGRPK